MRSMIVSTPGGGSSSSVSPHWRSSRRRVVASSPSGICTAHTPRSVQAMPHRPIAVSNKAKPSGLRRGVDMSGLDLQRHFVAAQERECKRRIVAKEDRSAFGFTAALGENLTQGGQMGVEVAPAERA